ncbi:MAG: TolC family protein [Alphaproteobacteria bacterium]|nr:TolC family protein [Alphaproteobacteria bacterium]
MIKFFASLMVIAVCSEVCCANDTKNKADQDKNKSNVVEEQKNNSEFFDAMQSALENNKEILAASKELKAVHENYVTASAAFRPTIQANAQYQANNRDDWSNSKSLGANSANGTYHSRTKSYGIGVKQNIYRGGADKATLNEADANIKAKWASYEAKKQSVLSKVASTYFKIIAKLGEIKHLIALLDSRKESIKVAEKMYTAGSAKNLDVAQSQASCAETVSNLANAEAELSAYISEFEEITGKKFNGKNSSEKIKIFDDTLTLDQMIKVAQKNNPTVIAAAEALNAAKHAVKKINIEFSPSLDVSYSYDQSYDPSTKKRSPTDEKFNSRGHTVALSLTVPIYDGGVGRAQRRQATQSEAKASIDYENAKSEIITQVTTVHAVLVAAKKKIAAANDAVSARELALHDTEQEYKAGTKIMNDVLEAQQQLFEARFMLINAENEYITNQCKANELLGRMNAKYLKLKDDSMEYKQHYHETVRKF